MNYRREFVRILDQVRLEWSKYHRYAPDTYDIMHALSTLISFLMVTPEDYDLLIGISKNLLLKTEDGKLYSASPICPELREILINFNVHINSMLEQENSGK